MDSFCKKETIPEGLPKELEALYACKNATNCLADAVKFNREASNKNKGILVQFEKDLDNYKLSKADYLNKLDRWTKKTAEFSEFSKKDGVNRQFWANEYDGTCWVGQNGGAANDWCQWAANKQGYNGESYFAKQWGSCFAKGGTVNFLCKKPDDIIAQETNEYQKIKPIFTLLEPKQSDYPLVQQIVIDDASINCCTNYLNSSGAITDNVQTCNQTIEKKIGDYVIPKEPVKVPVKISDIPIIPATSTSPLANIKELSSTDEEIYTDNSLTIGIIIAIVIALMISFSLSLMLVVSK